MNLYAKDINLYNDDMDIVSKFGVLSMEDQYLSYINSFRHIRDTRNRQLYWAQCLAKYGRDILPLIDISIESGSFYYNYRQPYDRSLGLIAYVLYEIDRKELLTQEDKEKYRQLYEKKIEEYVLKYKIIDGTVDYGIFCIEDFTERPVYLPRDVSLLRKYYEKKLGINGILEGNLFSTWEY